MQLATADLLCRSPLSTSRTLCSLQTIHGGLSQPHSDRAGRSGLASQAMAGTNFWPALWIIKTRMNWFVNICSTNANQSVNLCMSRCHVCSDGIFCQLAIAWGRLHLQFIRKLLHSVLQPKIVSAPGTQGVGLTKEKKTAPGIYCMRMREYTILFTV